MATQATAFTMLGKGRKKSDFFLLAK